MGGLGRTKNASQTYVYAARRWVIQWHQQYASFAKASHSERQLR